MMQQTYCTPSGTREDLDPLQLTMTLYVIARCRDKGIEPFTPDYRGVF